MATIPLPAAGDRKGVLVGGWKSKEDLSEPHVTEIGRFAVMSTKKQSKNEFKFKSMEKGKTKMVSGTNYRLILVVKDGKNCYQQCIIYGGGK
ncbi:hypothetical protein AB3S75_019703 [Citrus x aurantiifolia]